MGFRENKSQRKPKNVEYQHGIVVSCVGNKSPRVSTSINDGDTSIALRCRHGQSVEMPLLAELMFRDIGAGIPTYVRNDNSDAVYQVDSANTVTHERRLNGCYVSIGRS